MQRQYLVLYLDNVNRILLLHLARFSRPLHRFLFSFFLMTTYCYSVML